MENRWDLFSTLQEIIGTKKKANGTRKQFDGTRKTIQFDLVQIVQRL